MSTFEDRAPFYWTEKVMLGACDDLWHGARRLRACVSESADYVRGARAPRWDPKVLRDVLSDTRRGYNLMLQVIGHLEGRFGVWTWPEEPTAAAKCSGKKANGKPCSASRRAGTAFCRHHQKQAATAATMADLVAELAAELETRTTNRREPDERP